MKNHQSAELERGLVGAWSSHVFTKRICSGSSYIIILLVLSDHGFFGFVSLRLVQALVCQTDGTKRSPFACDSASHPIGMSFSHLFCSTWCVYKIEITSNIYNPTELFLDLGTKLQQNTCLELELLSGTPR